MSCGVSVHVTAELLVLETTPSTFNDGRVTVRALPAYRLAAATINLPKQDLHDLKNIVGCGTNGSACLGH